jgi:hypothetical protein
MDCDICFVCHRHIDYAALDQAYPHLCEEPNQLPPDDMNVLEEHIYWGDLCADCAQESEQLPPENLKQRFSLHPVLRK